MQPGMFVMAMSEGCTSLSSSPGTGSVPWAGHEAAAVRSSLLCLQPVAETQRSLEHRDGPPARLLAGLGSAGVAGNSHSQLQPVSLFSLLRHLWALRSSLPRHLTKVSVSPAQLLGLRL